MNNTIKTPIAYIVMIALVLGLMWMLSVIAKGQIKVPRCYTLDLRTMQEVVCVVKGK